MFTTVINRPKSNCPFKTPHVTGHRQSQEFKDLTITRKQKAIHFWKNKNKKTPHVKRNNETSSRLVPN